MSNIARRVKQPSIPNGKPLRTYIDVLVPIDSVNGDLLVPGTNDVTNGGDGIEMIAVRFTISRNTRFTRTPYVPAQYVAYVE